MRSDEDLDALIKEKEDKIEAADRAQKEGVEKLQARYILWMSSVDQ